MLLSAMFAATAPLPLNCWSRGVGGGGYFCTPSLSPLDPNTLYISTDMGTVFHSANGAAFWDSHAFGNLTGGPLARMQFTSDPAMLYVLDGRVDYVQYPGRGGLQECGRRQPWFRLTSDPCLNNDATRKKLRADPDRAVFCDWGFVHGTTNGGASWQALYVAPEARNAAHASTPRRRAYHGIGLENTACWWLAWLDTNTLFAGFSDFGALRSTNAGAAWIPASDDVNINTIDCCVTGAANRAYLATSSVHMLYESTTLQDNPINSGTSGILVSANRATSWTTLHDFAHP